jgi:hypothetical protein
MAIAIGLVTSTPSPAARQTTAYQPRDPEAGEHCGRRAELRGQDRRRGKRDSEPLRQLGDPEQQRRLVVMDGAVQVRHQPVAAERRHDSTQLGVAMLIDVRKVVRASERQGQQRHRHDHPGRQPAGCFDARRCRSEFTHRVHHARQVGATNPLSPRMNGTSSRSR